MVNIFSSVLKLGLSKASNRLDYARIIMVNWFVVVSICLGILLVVVNILARTYGTAVICAISVVVFLPTLYFNHKGMAKLGAVYFLNLAVLLTFAGVVVSYSSGRFTDTESIFFGAMTVAIFLFDGKMAYLHFSFSLLAMFIAKYIKYDYQGLTYGINFTLLCVNISVVAIILFAFTRVFKRTLLVALSKEQEGQDILFNLIDNVPLYIGIFDSEGRYAMVNKKYEEAFYLKREEIIGKRLVDIIPEENIKTYQPMLDKALAGESVEFLQETLMKNGQTIFANGKYVPVFDSNKKVKYVTVAVYDVTKLEQVKRELLEANNAKNRLFNIVAHDMRNPLGNFELLLNSTKQEVIAREDFNHWLGKIGEKFEPLKRTINELLEWSLSQINGIVPNKVDVDVVPLIWETFGLLQPQIQSKSIQCKVIGDIPNIYFDEDHFKAVIRNIIHNAVKFTPEKGVITVELAQHNGSRKISVRDSGGGMEEDIINAILKKQVVSSNPGTHGEVGTGIGLNFCMELIEKNGGTMTIDSVSGVSTTFQISIPG